MGVEEKKAEATNTSPSQTNLNESSQLKVKDFQGAFYFAVNWLKGVSLKNYLLLTVSLFVADAGLGVLLYSKESNKHPAFQFNREKTEDKIFISSLLKIIRSKYGDRYKDVSDQKLSNFIADSIEATLGQERKSTTSLEKYWGPFLESSRKTFGDFNIKPYIAFKVYKDNKELLKREGVYNFNENDELVLEQLKNKKDIAGLAEYLKLERTQGAAIATLLLFENLATLHDTLVKNFNDPNSIVVREAVPKYLDKILAVNKESSLFKKINPDVKSGEQIFGDFLFNEAGYSYDPATRKVSLRKNPITPYCALLSFTAYSTGAKSMEVASLQRIANIIYGNKGLYKNTITIDAGYGENTKEALMKLEIITDDDSVDFNRTKEKLEKYFYSNKDQKSEFEKYLQAKVNLVENSGESFFSDGRDRYIDPFDESIKAFSFNNLQNINPHYVKALYEVLNKIGASTDSNVIEFRAKIAKDYYNYTETRDPAILRYLYEEDKFNLLLKETDSNFTRKELLNAMIFEGLQEEALFLMSKFEISTKIITTNLTSLENPVSRSNLAAVTVTGTRLKKKPAESFYVEVVRSRLDIDNLKDKKGDPLVSTDRELETDEVAEEQQNVVTNSNANVVTNISVGNSNSNQAVNSATPVNTGSNININVNKKPR